MAFRKYKKTYECFDKILFTTDEKQKEWDSMDENVKKMAFHFLTENARKFSLEHTIDILIQTINELHDRILILEKK